MGPGEGSEELDGEVADEACGDEGEHGDLEGAGIDVGGIEGKYVERVEVFLRDVVDGAEPKGEAVGYDAGGEEDGGGEENEGEDEG